MTVSDIIAELRRIAGELSSTSAEGGQQSWVKPELIRLADELETLSREGGGDR